jgi:hypothetical protein
MMNWKSIPSKTVLLALILLLALGVIGGPLAAAPPAQEIALEELTRLAGYVPAGAPLFATARTDDAHFAAIDELLAAVAARLPEGEVPPDASLRDLLAAEGVDAWLGDQVAVAIPSVNSVMAVGPSSPTLTIFAVRDFAAAETWLDAELLDEDSFLNYAKETRPDGSLHYQPGAAWGDPYVLTEEALFMGLVDQAVLPGANIPRLSADVTFRQAGAALPEAGYNALVYLDTAEAITTLGAFAPMLLGPDMPRIDFDEVAGVVGQFALGFTILGDRSLVLDVAQLSTAATRSSSLNRDFLRHVPQDTALLLQGRRLGKLLTKGIEGLYRLDALLVQMGAMPWPDAGPFANTGPGDLATFLRLSFEGTTGLDLLDTLPLLDGNFVAYMEIALTPEGFPQTTNNWVLSVAGRDTAAILADSIARLATDIFAAATYEQGRLIVPLSSLLQVPVVTDLSLAAGDNLLAFGSPAAVDFALNQGPDIRTGERFEAASALFLPDAAWLLYADAGQLRAVLDEIIASAPLDDFERRELEEMSLALGLLDTATISASRADGVHRARLTLTLSLED